MKYDPDYDLNLEEWGNLSELERIDCVERYHRRKRLRMPNVRMHAAVHAVVESQVAMGDSYPAKEVLARLMRQGLDRHEAIHAIGTVVSGAIYRALKDKDPGADLNAEYLEKLKQLTPESWRKQFEKE